MPHPKRECESWDIRNILQTMESFVTLQMLHPGKYYSNNCWWKCTCPFYFFWWKCTCLAPQYTVYDPYVAGVQLKEDQFPQLDPRDPLSYRTYVDWPSPMPMDTLIKINEIQAKMAMGLESKRGALRDLGTQFPDQKMQEIFEEIVEDAKEQGALGLIQAQIAQFTMQATGMTPDGQPLVVPGQVDETGKPMGPAPMVDPILAQEIMARAYQPMPPETVDFEAGDP